MIWDYPIRSLTPSRANDRHQQRGMSASQYRVRRMPPLGGARSNPFSHPAPELQDLMALTPLANGYHEKTLTCVALPIPEL